MSCEIFNKVDCIDCQEQIIVRHENDVEYDVSKAYRLSKNCLCKPKLILQCTINYIIIIIQDIWLTILQSPCLILDFLTTISLFFRKFCTKFRNSNITHDNQLGHELETYSIHKNCLLHNKSIICNKILLDKDIIVEEYEAKLKNIMEINDLRKEFRFIIKNSLDNKLKIFIKLSENYDYFKLIINDKVSYECKISIFCIYFFFQ